MQNLTPKEAEIALAFLNRVDLKGTESEAHAIIKAKLMAIRDGRELPQLPGNVADLKGAKGRGKIS